RLPRQAQTVGAVPLVDERLATLVRRVEERVLRGVVIVARNRVRVPELAVRREEPDFVFLDRATERHVDVVDVLLLVHRLKAPRLKFRRQVVTQHAIVGTVGKQETGEVIPALLGYQVRLNTAELVLGLLTAELDAHLLCSSRVEVEAPSRS